ncbi:hypothetical protein P389DRAFT_180779 [Cystobasidium minutum MCA 4210]|uniref:uncharacterized protein n=1 Tax=Cystobasidium minutum MCA 4210 TaxID=1397322 RepID=UPI0034CE1B18|eukprot:jgi/Rhomi1/180779/fgenesh1_pg.5_\
MRWASWQLGGNKLLALLSLLLLVPPSLASHAALETCPVNPFQVLDGATSCAASPRQDVVTNTLEEHPYYNATTKPDVVALPTSTDATAETSQLQDDRPSSITAEAAPATDFTASIQTSDKEALSTSTSTPASSASLMARTTKEDVWTEIDESLGLSWTPELEAEYAKAQRDFEVHTQAATVSLESPILSPSQGEAGTHSGGAEASMPEFPSYAEWKERHLAAGIVAGSQAAKDGREHRSKKQTVTSNVNDSAKHDDKKLANQLHTSSDKKQEPHSDRLDDLWSDQNVQVSNEEEEGTTALAAHRQRIFHPVPHAGTGDPTLDPLIALRDRTNYASFDCSATLIRSSKSTKFASAILSSKKDRYMLTPCAQKEKYVIVELCDEIQIDNIVLANLEFFSSMFKMFRVSGGTAYPESAGTWNEIGTFRASNARGMQVFRPPEPAKGGFYRYLRIDFLTHYGSEYYCPVSLLKVYGLTQLDAYRRDEERQNRLATSEEGELFAEIEPVQPEITQEEPVYLQLVDPVKIQPRMNEVTPASPSEASAVSAAESPSTMIAPASASEAPQTWSRSISVPPVYASTTQSPVPVTAAVSSQSDGQTGKVETLISSEMPSTSVPLQTQSAVSLSDSGSGTSENKGSGIPKSEPARKQSNDATISVHPSQSPTAVVDRPSETRTASSGQTTSDQPEPLSTTKKASSSPSLVYRSAQQPSASPARRNDSKPQVIYTHAHSANHQPNESIYGTIMKRLLALEVNATLSTAYLEEQSRVVRETFRRVEDRLSNMEKTRAKYDQLLRRVMLDLELHRARHEAERSELSGQLNVLSREMLMEKRLGIAQLLALVVLMFFVVLTRGSPSSPILNLAHSRTPNVSTTFPTFPKSRRPRSLRDEPLDVPTSADYRTRERRGMGSGSRGGLYANGNGLGRNASIKRPYRTSNNTMKRPLTALPLRRNGFEFPSSAVAGFPVPAVVEAGETAPPPNTATFPGRSGRSSRASSPIAEIDGSALGISDYDLSSSTITLRGSTPPLYPAPPKTRRSPVETLRRKLRLMQPRRSASLDGTDLPSPLAKVLHNNPSTSSVLDRRKKFSIGSVPYLRERSDTVDTISSMTSEENSKAWLSTSEDSGDERSNSTPPSGRSPRFESLSSLSTQNSPSRPPYVLPSPDPSDAETPAPVYRDLPPHPSPGKTIV